MRSNYLVNSWTEFYFRSKNKRKLPTLKLVNPVPPLDGG